MSKSLSHFEQTEKIQSLETKLNTLESMRLTNAAVHTVHD
jgi:hypothetical protein